MYKMFAYKIDGFGQTDQVHGDETPDLMESGVLFGFYCKYSLSSVSGL